ncbi:MAG: hypothetical protein HC781_13615 [Leptolyngbyaceae cyanobacterium CSU_1_4]|nr:hypothetical protein [Leptolyngbyaceae cyanobacterium CSU_1_4]
MNNSQPDNQPRSPKLLRGLSIRFAIWRGKKKFNAIDLRGVDLTRVDLIGNLLLCANFWLGCHYLDIF